MRERWDMMRARFSNSENNEKDISIVTFGRPESHSAISTTFRFRNFRVMGAGLSWLFSCMATQLSLIAIRLSAPMLLPIRIAAKKR